MHSLWFAVLVLSIFCGFGEAIPVNSVDKLATNNDSETRLIVPPEMTSNYFALLKDKSEIGANLTKTESADSTPMNFLRSTEISAKNVSSLADKPVLVFDGSKQTPVFITIPIFIASGSDGLPIVATSIEKLVQPKKTKETVKAKEQKQKDSSLSLEQNKPEENKN